MQVSKNTVVTIDYTLTGPEGNVIDSSRGKQPLAYIHGTGNLIPGLERVLEGKAAGENVKVTIAPAGAYGLRDDKLVQSVPRAAFQGVPEIKVGMQFRSQNNAIVTITKIEGENVTVDANHALAGVTLTFDVDIKDVRKASQEELEHGHVHGSGGHHH
ncbi:MAG: peptidylprolyl isomerase [Phycisphaerales bacterium]|nr:peptidylprolyl isomerase [Phycisphaerales bacterium]